MKRHGGILLSGRSQSAKATEGFQVLRHSRNGKTMEIVKRSVVARH